MSFHDNHHENHENHDHHHDINDHHDGHRSHHDSHDSHAVEEIKPRHESTHSEHDEIYSDHSESLMEDRRGSISKDRSRSADDKDNRESVADREFDHWYPNWETWQFRRTLSYWVSILFVEGSVLFILGAAFAMTELAKESSANMQALVSTPYFVGGICFTLGAYAGML